MCVTLNTDRAFRPIPVRIGIDQNFSDTTVQGPTMINFEFETGEESTLTVEMFDKQDMEAVIVEQISFFGISDPKFVWAGIYEPVYPEPWATQQTQQGVVLKQQLISHNYLSWNGQWRLTFSVPVFTWIHKIQDLGWIYG